jgi:hypothetical protein
MAEDWQTALAETGPWDEVIGTTRVPAQFSTLWASRAAHLNEFADHYALWPDDLYG